MRAHTITRPALLLSLLALAALGLIARERDDDEPVATNERGEPYESRKSCGSFRVSAAYPAIRVEVMAGNVPCSAARRVMKEQYTNPRYEQASSWSCTGPEGVMECEKRPGVSIRARFAGDRTRQPAGAEPSSPIVRLATDPEAGVSFLLGGRVLTARLLASAPGKTRKRVRGARIRATCGKGFIEGPGLVERQTETRRWPASGDAAWQIESLANKWARAFATAAASACKYETQPLCERIACERAGHRPIRNCAPPSEGFRTSFRDATVKDIALERDNAAATFSNGVTIELIPVGEFEPGGGWWISKIAAKPPRGPSRDQDAGR